MDKSRVEPTIFFMEKISFLLKLFSGHFYGQSFIKTVRDPLNISVGLESVIKAAIILLRDNLLEMSSIGLDKQIFLIEMVLLGTHNLCFG